VVEAVTVEQHGSSSGQPFGGGCRQSRCCQDCHCNRARGTCRKRRTRCFTGRSTPSS
jgi:hypothetical protein